MSILSGIHDAEYLAQFLGKRIAIKTSDPNVYELYPVLYSICSNHSVEVQDSGGNKHLKFWSDCENPYIVLLDKEIEIK